MGRVRIVVGDVARVLAGLEPGSFHACLCDPPYALEFMGRGWDAPWREAGDVPRGELAKARYFYCPKVGDEERAGSTHPTLKPQRLCRWLATILLPPARPGAGPRRLFVPFSGAGSECVGALRAGWDEVLAVERDEAAVADAERRIRADAPLLWDVEVVRP